MKNRLVFIFLAMIGATLLFFAGKYSVPQTDQNGNHWNDFFARHFKPDTIIVRDTFTVEKVVKPSVPNHVIEFAKDTTLRDSVLKDSLEIIQVKSDRSNLEVAKIDSRGIVTLTHYELPWLSYYTIDYTGAVKIRKRTGLKVILFSALTAAIGYTGYRIVKNRIS